VEDHLAAGEGELELASDGLRRAVGDLDVLVGRIGVEDALGDVFSRFCIGK